MSAPGDARKFAKRLERSGLLVGLEGSVYVVRNHAQSVLTKFSRSNFNREQEARAVALLRRHGVNLR